MGKSESFRAARGSSGRFVSVWSLGRAALLFVAVCACDVGRGGPEPIPECVTYTASAEQCLGARVASKLRASFAKPPADEAGRSAQRTQCVEQHNTLRRSCR